MSETLPVIQSMWLGHIGTIERLSMASYIANGHPYHLYLYEEPHGKIPDGVVVKDGNEILPKEIIWSFRTPAQFADLFRLNLLYKLGNFWCDCDTVCLRPFDFKQTTVLVEESVPGGNVKSIAWAMRPEDLRDIWQGGGRFIGSAFMKFPAGSDVLSYALQCCQEIRPQWKTMPWITIGPALITRSANIFRLMAFPYTTFQPIPGYLTHLFIDPSIKIPEESYAVHLWRSGWNNDVNSGGIPVKLDSEATYHPDCPFEVLKRRYL